MRISDWSSDVCSSDLAHGAVGDRRRHLQRDVVEIEVLLQWEVEMEIGVHGAAAAFRRHAETRQQVEARMVEDRQRIVHRAGRLGVDAQQLIDALRSIGGGKRSEEHTSELQSLMRI